MGRFTPGNDFGLHLIDHRDGEVRRRAAEHVGENDDAIAAIDRAHRVDDVGAALFHVVIGADGDGAHLVLGPENVLGRGDEFVRQTAVGHNHDANHSEYSRHPPVGLDKGSYIGLCSCGKKRKPHGIAVFDGSA